MKNLINRKYEALRLKVRGKYIKKTRKQRRRKINCEDFTIISNNCWGGTVYQTYGLKYNTPTIGMFFTAEDYLKFVYNIREYINYELEFIDIKNSTVYKLDKSKLFSDFPVAKLKDIEIYFMHYKSEQEAREKWKRRCERINWDKILYKFSNQNFCTKQHIEKFMRLPEKNKICFVNKNYNVEGTIFIKQFFDSEDIKASYEPFGNSKKINVNELINNL